MWIVKFKDNTRHSAWNRKSEALHQAEVLQDRGYIKLDPRCETLQDYVEYDSTVHCYSGHYYV